MDVVGIRFNPVLFANSPIPEYEVHVKFPPKFTQSPRYPTLMDMSARELFLESLIYEALIFGKSGELWLNWNFVRNTWEYVFETSLQPRSKKLRRNVDTKSEINTKYFGIRLIIENIMLGELSQLSATKYMLYILECETFCSHFFVRSFTIDCEMFGYQ